MFCPKEPSNVGLLCRFLVASGHLLMFSTAVRTTCTELFNQFD